MKEEKPGGAGWRGRWGFISLTMLAAAGVVYVLGRLEGDRMVAAGQGWEMAFYWSPLVFMAVDAFLGLGVLAGVAGIAFGPGVGRRVLSAVAALSCAIAYLSLPWRRF